MRRGSTDPVAPCEDEMRIGVVFNPRSGVRRGQQLYRMTNAAIIGSGNTPIFVTVERGIRLENSVSRLVEEVDVVATIGGDGTLNGVVNGVLDSSRPGTPVAFFQSGRGRDTARTLPSFSLKSLGTTRIDWSRTVQVDVGRATGQGGASRYFINVSNVGLSAEAARVAGKLPRQIGTSSYILGAVKAFLTERPRSVPVSIDGGPSVVLDDVLLLAMCNGRAFGGGLYVAPEASATDGLLELVAVRNANLLDLGRNLSSLRDGTLLGHPALTRWRARTVAVDPCDLAPIDLDGEMWGSVPITYSIVPSALNWIGPSS
jgi:diacylglycerol kinase (ATP)